jgi:hypothetical protein
MPDVYLTDGNTEVPVAGRGDFKMKTDAETGNGRRDAGAALND